MPVARGGSCPLLHGSLFYGYAPVYLSVTLDRFLACSQLLNIMICLEHSCTYLLGLNIHIFLILYVGMNYLSHRRNAYFHLQ